MLIKDYVQYKHDCRHVGMEKARVQCARIKLMNK